MYFSKLTKRTVSIMLMVLFVSLASFAEIFKAPAHKSVQFTDTTTTHVYEIKNKQYPIYKSKKGRYYIWRISKNTNKPYKYYLPKEIQKQIKENNKIVK